MTGWETKTDDVMKMGKPAPAAAPSEQTLAEVAAAQQRQIVEQLIEGLAANPDLVTRMHSVLRVWP